MKHPDGLSEVPAGIGGDPFEEPDLRHRADFQSLAPRAGADFKAIANKHVQRAGGSVERLGFEIDQFTVDAQVRGANGRSYLVLARGTPDEQERSGLRRSDTVEKVGFMAMQLARCQDLPILIVTSDLPARSTKTGHYLASLSPDVWDVVAYRGDFRGFQRMRRAFEGPVDAAPPAAPWRAAIESSIPTLFESLPTAEEEGPGALKDEADQGRSG